jgi:eukaryotic-like serine/threonine-protein kinase
MATVYFARALGPVGFRRIVAIKRMHPHFAKDPEFVAMFLDEATLAARIQHPNVVATLDVVAQDGEVAIVMDYIRGEALSGLVRAARTNGAPIPIGVAAALLVGTLNGLHAAHEARSEDGELLGIIHRDVSPPNILVGLDGLPRIVDFGVAKAVSRIDVTREGQFKGKIRYAAPEQLIRSARKGDGSLDRRVDIFAAGALFWELLAGRRLFQGDDDFATIGLVIRAEVPPFAPIRPDVPPALEEVVRRSLEREPEMRFATAEEFALAIENATPIASPRVVAEWVKSLAAEVLAQRDARVKELENSNSDTHAEAHALAAHLARASVTSTGPVLLRSHNVSDASYEDVTHPGPGSPSGARAPGSAGEAMAVLLRAGFARRVPALIVAGALLGVIVLLVIFRGGTTSTAAPLVQPALVSVVVPAAASSAAPAPEPSASASTAPLEYDADESPPGSSASVATEPQPAPGHKRPASKGRPQGNWRAPATNKGRPGRPTTYVPDRP